MPSFLSNLLKLTTGTLIAQVVAISLVPVVTRIYSPDFFGVNQLFLSVASVIAVVSTLSYHYALMITDKDEDSMNVFALCIVCLLGISAATGVVFVGFADWFGNVLNTPLIADYFIWLPIFIILLSSFTILNYWFSRKVRYGILAKGAVMNSVSSRMVQIGSGLIYASPIGLILGSVMGYAVADLFMFRSLREDIPLVKSVTVQRMRELAVRYSNFSIYTSAGNLANSLSWELPAFMLAYFFNSTVVGYYALAVLAVRLPMTLIGTAVSQVFFQRASEERIHTGGVKSVVREIHTRLIAVGIFPFVVFMILAPDLFTFIFGASWHTAGIYAMILAPWFFAVFIFSPISSLFAVLEKQKAYLAFEIMILCTWAMIFSVGGTFGDPIFTLSLFSIGGTLLWGLKSTYLIRESEAGYRDSLLSLGRSLLISIVVSIPLMLVVILEFPLFLLLFVAGVTTVAYFLLMFFTDTLIRRELMGILVSFIPAHHFDWMKQ